MWLLSDGATAEQLITALTVGVTIGVYTVNDSRAVRSYGITYPFAAFAAIGVVMSVYVVVTRAQLTARGGDRATTGSSGRSPGRWPCSPTRW